MSPYSCPVTFKKYFVTGPFEGITVEESMKHVCWEYACKWAAEVTESFSCDYVVLEMTNDKTGEVAKF
jgi:hypothetical protein